MEMTVKSEGKELVITRVLNAPRELVFKAWSEAEHLKRWWGPKGFEINVAQLDFRPGGFFHYNMQSLLMVIKCGVNLCIRKSRLSKKLSGSTAFQMRQAILSELPLAI
ncbi:SRPBCC domain-containing protein [Cohnella yongneupensis]|uniref:SRPBCC domain-containing protein n=1 Tax=Cohnella yongneupensis TaxID=425006 RepID=A0ABW0R2T4_9BACL